MATWGSKHGHAKARDRATHAKKLFHKRPSTLHGAAGSLARRENAGAYAR
jgi:hypothetical protein